MSSVQIIECVLKRSADQLVGHITLESMFNETELRLGIAYRPKLWAIASPAFTSKKLISVGNIAIGQPSVYLNQIADEFEVAVGNVLIQPAGLALVRTEIPVSINCDSLFRLSIDLENATKKANMFFSVGPGLDVRVQLNPDMGDTSATFSNLKVLG